MKRKYDSCVFKRDWKHYKTCFECKCQCTEYKLNLIGRIQEAIVLGWYRIVEVEQKLYMEDMIFQNLPIIKFV